MKITVKIDVEIGDADVSKNLENYLEDLKDEVLSAIEVTNDAWNETSQVSVELELKEG